MNNNNSCNNNNEHINKINNFVFNNIYIKSIILNHLNKFNILYNNIIFESIEEWDQFKYKEYLNKVTFGFDIDLIQQPQLPENIKQIQITTLPSSKPTSVSYTNSSNDIITKLQHVDSIIIRNKYLYTSIQELESPLFKSIISTSKLKYLELTSYAHYYEFEPNTIPPSITDLKIEFNFDDNLKLLKNILPRGLKRLKLCNLESFEDGCLPESLTELTIKHSAPELINQISSNLNLARLKYFSNRKPGTEITNQIKLPNSLQELSINCYSFNSSLPNNLKKLDISLGSYDNAIQLPSTLEQLFIQNQDTAPIQFESLPVGLKVLHVLFSRDNSRLQVNPFPPSLIHIEFEFSTFNQALQVNQLPPGLSYLDLGDKFNQVIDVGVLPSTLNTLVLGSSYSYAINPLVIPSNLKSLIIQNQRYNHPIHLPPSTHPNTLVTCHNINLYYDPSNTDIRVLRLPFYFNSPLSRLQLQDKSQLEHLHLGYAFSHPIQLSDLPINNRIKTLELSDKFQQTINLEHFQNLETLIINCTSDDNSPIKNIITTTTPNNNNNNNNNKTIYNFYKLQNIIVPSIYFNTFITQLDCNFYQFIKLKKNNNNNI